MRSPNPWSAIANSRKIRNLLVLHFDVRKVGTILNGLGFVSRPLYLFPQFFQDKATEHLCLKWDTAKTFE